MKNSTNLVTVRPIRHKDAAAVARMITRLNVFHNEPQMSAANFILRHCFGSKKLTYVYVAFAKGKPIGFALSYDWVNFVRSHLDCTLDLLFVEEPWRAKGVGRALIAYVASAAMQRGCRRVLTSSSTKNLKAKKFYLGLGFALRTKNPHRYLIEGKALRQFTKKHKI